MAVDFGTLGARGQAAASYIGYFNRAPDPGGLAFWNQQIDSGLNAGRGLTQVLGDVSESFRLSAEAQGIFPFLAPGNAASAGQAEVEGFVSDVFLNLFNRLPSPAGLDFWTSEILERLGQGINIGDIVIDIIAGAQNGASVQPLGSDTPGVVNDAVTVENKIDVGITYAERFSPGLWTVADDLASASRVIAPVDDTQESVQLGITLIDEARQDDALDAADFERTRVATAPDGGPGNGESGATTVSDDGRVFAFRSAADNLVPGDTNGVEDIFVQDLSSGTLERISLGPSGVEANGESDSPALSADGRFVAFSSTADNLVAGDTNAAEDIFVADRETGAVELISHTPNGAAASGFSFNPAISGNGRWVAFESSADNLVANDDNDATDIFLYDRQTGDTVLASRTPEGTPGNSFSFMPDISADGRYVVFESNASDLVPGEALDDRDADVFLFDHETTSVSRISSAPDGSEGNDNSIRPSISANGRYIAFDSQATNLGFADADDGFTSFVYDLTEDVMLRVSWTDLGLGSGEDLFNPRVSDSGIVFANGEAQRDFPEFGVNAGIPVILGYELDSGRTIVADIGGLALGTNIGQREDEEVVPFTGEGEANSFLQAFAAVGGGRLVGIETNEGNDRALEGNAITFDLSLTEAAQEPVTVVLQLSEDREVDPADLDGTIFAGAERLDEFGFSSFWVPPERVSNRDPLANAVDGSQRIAVEIPAGETEMRLPVRVFDEYLIQSSEPPPEDFDPAEDLNIAEAAVDDRQREEEVSVEIVEVQGPAAADPARTAAKGTGIDRDRTPSIGFERENITILTLPDGGETIGSATFDLDILSENLIDFDFAVTGTAENGVDATVEAVGQTNVPPLAPPQTIVDFTLEDSFFTDGKRLDFEIGGAVNATLDEDRDFASIIGGGDLGSDVVIQ